MLLPLTDTLFVIACPPLVNNTVGLLMFISVTNVNVTTSPTFALVVPKALLLVSDVLLVTGADPAV